MTPDAGEIWLADSGGEQRRRVLVVSDRRLPALASRVVVAPVLDVAPDVLSPWYVVVDGGVVAVHLMASVSIDRLLERVGAVPFETLRRVRQVIHLMTT